MLTGPGRRFDGVFLGALTSEKIVRVSAVSQLLPYGIGEQKPSENRHLTEELQLLAGFDQEDSKVESSILESVSFIDAACDLAGKDDRPCRLTDGSGRRQRLQGRA
jgi:hypothetical protein